jgi:hypothetical protein
MYLNRSGLGSIFIELTRFRDILPCVVVDESVTSRNHYFFWLGVSVLLSIEKENLSGQRNKKRAEDPY